MMRARRPLFLFFLLIAAATRLAAQGNPTGAIRGQVVDPDGLPLPGVTVTASSEALQGQRAAVTSSNGDFIIPFLPPGQYIVVFELASFRTQTQKIGVAMAETLPMKVTMSLAALTESVTVTGSASTEVLKTATIAETYKADTIERLPVGRALTDAVLLAPGSANNGPTQSDGTRNIIMSGALSYENLFLVNGVTVNENLRGQPLLLYIEDAIQETKVSTGNISAEYGRFQGGVVNMITKSGGNRLGGSFRASLANDAWQARTPYPGDQKIASLTPTFEMTAGGPLWKDKIWVFGAGRLTKPEKNQTLSFSGINYTMGIDDKRGEGKVTYALNPSNTLKGSYTKRALATTNNNFGTIMDLASLYNSSTDFSLSVLNYTSVLRNNLFLEGQYSKKVNATMDVGSRYSDLVRGTPIWDRAHGQARFNSPTFCAVCGSGWLEHRDNWDWFVKMSYFLSTARSGSHNLILGFDNYKEWRKNDNWQSGSGYRVQATSTIIDGANIYPVFNNNNSTYIEYLPLVAESVGNDIRTYSGFVNDAWRLNGRLSFNIGLRYDQNRSKDQTGLPVVKDAKVSPRLGFTWDLNGDGRWTANAGFARYVAAISTALVDAGSAGGRTATYSYFYQGPPINTGSGQYLTAAQALPQLFNWFLGNGGLDRMTRNAPSIPGVTTRVGSSTAAPNSDEYSIGIARDLNSRGTVRLDYLYRRYGNIYGDYLNTSTGRVSDPTGRQYDLVVVQNTPDAKRTYQGVIANASYRLPSWQIGGNYTLSWSRGNVDGEDSGSGPIRAAINTYMEYKQPSWNSPLGYNSNDQRHKVRAWLAYLVPAPKRLGELYTGVVQRFDSALPYDSSGSIDSRPYVANPGYLAPPSTVAYYFTGRNALRFDRSWSTDLSLNWSMRLPAGHATELFFRGLVTNAFNNSAVLTGDSTILTAASPGSARGLQPFNPFIDTAVYGLNWVHGPSFGQPIGPGSYQVPRTFSCSLGVRF